MLFPKLACTLFPVSLFVYLIGLGMAPSAQSISITRNLSWQGTNRCLDPWRDLGR